MIPSTVFVTAIVIQTTFHSPANFEKSSEYAEDIFTCFVDLEKAYNRVSCEKLWRVLGVYGADGRQLLHGRQVTAFLLRSLCPCRES